MHGLHWPLIEDLNRKLSMQASVHRLRHHHINDFVLRVEQLQHATAKRGSMVCQARLQLFSQPVGLLDIRLLAKALVQRARFYRFETLDFACKQFAGALADRIDPSTRSESCKTPMASPVRFCFRSQRA